MAEEMQEEEPDSPLKVKLSKLADQISKFWIYRCNRDRSYVFCIFYYNGRWISGIFFLWDQKGLQDLIDAVSLAVVIICMCSTRRIAAYDISCINAKYK